MFGGMMFFWVILIVLAVFFVRSLFQSKHSSRKNMEPTPRQILEQRYARGEIDQEQYKLMASDLK